MASTSLTSSTATSVSKGAGPKSKPGFRIIHRLNTIRRFKAAVARGFRKVFLCIHRSKKNAGSAGGPSFVMPYDYRSDKNSKPHRSASKKSIASLRYTASTRSVGAPRSIRYVHGMSTPSIYVTLPTIQHKAKYKVHNGDDDGSQAADSRRKSLRYSHPTVTAVMKHEKTVTSTKSRSRGNSSARSWVTIDSETDGESIFPPSVYSGISVPATVDLDLNFPRVVNVKKIAHQSGMFLQDAMAKVDGVKLTRPAVEYIVESEHGPDMFTLAAAALPVLTVPYPPKEILGPVVAFVDDKTPLEELTYTDSWSNASKDSEDDVDIFKMREAALAILETPAGVAEKPKAKKHAKFVISKATPMHVDSLHIKPKSTHPNLLVPGSADKKPILQTWFYDTLDDDDEPETKSPVPGKHDSHHMSLYLAYHQSFDPFNTLVQDKKKNDKHTSTLTLPAALADDEAASSDRHKEHYTHVENMGFNSPAHIHGNAETARAPPLTKQNSKDNSAQHHDTVPKPSTPLHSKSSVGHEQPIASWSVPKAHSMNNNGFPILTARKEVYSAEPMYQKRSLIEDEIKQMKKKAMKQAKLEKEVIKMKKQWGLDD